VVANVEVKGSCSTVGLATFRGTDTDAVDVARNEMEARGRLSRLRVSKVDRPPRRCRPRRRGRSCPARSRWKKAAFERGHPVHGRLSSPRGQNTTWTVSAGTPRSCRFSTAAFSFNTSMPVIPAQRPVGPLERVPDGVLPAVRRGRRLTLRDACDRHAVLPTPKRKMIFIATRYSVMRSALHLHALVDHLEAR